MPILLNSDGKIDLETAKVKDEVLPEKEYRARLAGVAQRLGCLKEFLLTLKKYEDLMRNCKNENERKDISELGVVAIYKILGSHGSLAINGKMVIKE
jgi:hypothetical protein